MGRDRLALDAVSGWSGGHCVQALPFNARRGKANTQGCCAGFSGTPITAQFALASKGLQTFATGPA